MAEESISVIFPVAGIDTAGEYGSQRQNTTADAVNVRVSDPLEGRMRGGSRHGLEKYPNQQIPEGAELIQCLGQITVVSGDFLLIAFNDYNPTDVTDTTTSNNPSLPRHPPGSEPTVPVEGSGVQPNRNYPQNPRRRVQLVPDDPTAVDGQTVTLTATVTRRTAGTNVSGVTVTLRTNPEGQDGDGDTAVTNGSGVATFTVNESNFEGEILYTASNEYTSA